MPPAVGVKGPGICVGGQVVYSVACSSGWCCCGPASVEFSGKSRFPSESPVRCRCVCTFGYPPAANTVSIDGGQAAPRCRSRSGPSSGLLVSDTCLQYASSVWDEAFAADRMSADGICTQRSCPREIAGVGAVLTETASSRNRASLTALGDGHTRGSNGIKCRGLTLIIGSLQSALLRCNSMCTELKLV